MPLRRDLETTELPTEEADAVERTVRERAGEAPSTPPRPDAFRYEITAPDEPELAPVLVHEHEVPPELRGLVDSVSSSGEIEGRGSQD